MAALGPFERAPVVAVAVSGGPDSLALTLLANAWANARRGKAVGLSVDHGLRPEATDECRRVGAWLGGWGIEHHTLVRRGAAPTRGVQAAARQARYRLLTDWCKRYGVLHLLLAHHRDDQAETFLMRLERGSGLDGLAGMSVLSADGGVRLLRPLLATPKADLIELLTQKQQDWIEDPSNRDPAFKRSQLRRRLSQRSAAAAAALARTARDFGVHRCAVSAMTSDLAAAAVDLYPAGYARLTLRRFGGAPAAVRRRLLGRLLMCVGGTPYPPPANRLAALDGWLSGPDAVRGRTLAGCRLLPRPECLLICREVGRLPEAIRVAPGFAGRWDRFAIRVGQRDRGLNTDDIRVRRLGADGWRQIAETVFTTLPAPVRPALPSLWRGNRLLSAPHIPYNYPESDTEPAFSAVFEPRQSLVPASFTLA